MSIIKYVLIVILIGIAAIGLFFGYNKISEKKGNDRIISDALIIDKIKNISKFCTVEYFITDVVKYDEKTPWFLPDKKLLVIAKGKVIGGFDLNKGFECKISKQPICIDIVFPSAEIIAADISYEYYDIRGLPTPEDHTLFLAKAKHAVRESALKMGLRSKTENNMSMFMTNFLKALIPDAQINIRFRENVKENKKEKG